MSAPYRTTRDNLLGQVLATSDLADNLLTYQQLSDMIQLRHEYFLVRDIRVPEESRSTHSSD